MFEVVAILILALLIVIVFEIKRTANINRKAIQMILTLYNKYKSDLK